MKLSKLSFNDGKSISISINGAIQYENYTELREAYINESKALAITLDLTHVSKVDCSAIGMILLLQDFAKQNGITFTLINSQHMQPKNMMLITNITQYVEYFIEQGDEKNITIIEKEGAGE